MLGKASVLAAIFLVAVSVSGQPNQSTSRKENDSRENQSTTVITLVENHAAADQSNKAADYPPYWYAALKRPDWLLVIVGIVATIAALLTLAAIKRQADILERQIVLEQRPRISVRNFYFHEIKSIGGLPPAPWGLQPGSLLAGQFYAANIGGTDASIVEWHCEVVIGSILPMKRPYEGEDGIRTNQRVPPGGTATFTFARSNAISSAEIGTIAGSSGALYVMGWLIYEDALKIQRRTGFCRRYDFGVQRFVPVDNPDYEHGE